MYINNMVLALNNWLWLDYKQVTDLAEHTQIYKSLLVTIEFDPV